LTAAALVARLEAASGAVRSAIGLGNLGRTPKVPLAMSEDVAAKSGN